MEKKKKFLHSTFCVITNARLITEYTYPFPQIAQLTTFPSFGHVKGKFPSTSINKVCPGSPMWHIVIDWNNQRKTKFINNLFKFITKTRLFKYIEHFTSKNWKFSDKKSDSFHISAQNINCEYLLEPPSHNLCFWAKIRKIMYTPLSPSFTI